MRIFQIPTHAHASATHFIDRRIFHSKRNFRSQLIFRNGSTIKTLALAKEAIFLCIFIFTKFHSPKPSSFDKHKRLPNFPIAIDASWRVTRPRAQLISDHALASASHEIVADDKTRRIGCNKEDELYDLIHRCQAAKDGIAVRNLLFGPSRIR
jgi:hypothetical protein